MSLIYNISHQEILAALAARKPYFILCDKNGCDCYSFAQIEIHNVPLPVLADLLDCQTYDPENLAARIGYEPVLTLSNGAVFHFNHNAINFLKEEMRRLKATAKNSRPCHTEIHSDHGNLSVGVWDNCWRYFFQVDDFVFSSNSAFQTYRPETNGHLLPPEIPAREIVYQIGEQINLAELFDQA